MTNTPEPITIGRKTYTVERPSGRKMTRVGALLRALSRESRTFQRALTEFTAEYERENVVELDRVQARLIARRDVLRDPDGAPVLIDGEPALEPHPIDLLTDADWRETGNVWRRPRTPNMGEIAAAMFDVAMDAYEDRVYELVALFTLTNQQVSEAWRQGGDVLGALVTERVDELLDESYADELAELAAYVGESLQHHLIDGIRDNAGARLGKLLRTFRGEPNPPSTSTPEPDELTPEPSTTGPQTAKPLSSTDSPASTDGPPTGSSTNHSTSSADSPTDSTPTTPSEHDSSRAAPPA